MTVSIIIPIYNVSDYVEQCLQSVMEQSYQDIECILVDDCTPDDSIEKCLRMMSEYNGPIQFKILHHKRNRGLSAARNTGMDAANGDYIYFLDSDDYIYPITIQTLVNTIEEEENIDWACGNFDRNIPFPPHIKVNNGVYTNALFLFSNRKVYIMVWNHLYRTSFLKKNCLRFKEGVYHEDILWTFSIACHAKKIAIQNIVTYFYRERIGSICNIPLQQRYADICNVCSKMIEYVFEKGLEKKKEIFYCVNGELKRYYLKSLFSKQPDFVFTFYKYLRKTTFWSFWQIWKLSHDWCRICIHFHRFMPEQIGFKYFQYVFAKCFDNK